MKVRSKLEYRVVIEPLAAKDGGGFIATVPDLPGCMSDGDTPEGALANVGEAIAAWIEEARAKSNFSPDAVDRLRAEYDERIEQLEHCADNPDDCRGEIATPQYQRLQHQALRIERKTIIRLRNERVINDDALRRIQRDLDLAEARLTGG